MSGLDWGSVPTWVSALGTTGSLTAAVGIIRRDHLKGERADANAFSCWMDHDPDDLASGKDVTTKPHNTVFARNNGTRPIHDVVVLTWSGTTVEFGQAKTLTRTLLPGAEAHVSSPPAGSPWKPTAVAVAFRDAEGAHWLRDLHAQSLHSRNLVPTPRQLATSTRLLEKQARINHDENSSPQRQEGVFTFSHVSPPWTWRRRPWHRKLPIG